MATIGLVCVDEGDRRKLSLMAGESGHRVEGAGRLLEAVELLRERPPRAMLVVDSPQQDAETAVRELLRVSPLLPVVVALSERNATRAVRLMRSGASEVVAPPWTREALQACLAKALRLPGTVYSVAKVPRRPTAAVYFFSVLTFFGVCFGALAVRRQARLAQEALEHKEYWDVPYKHPAGMAFDKGELWVADWFTQSLYGHDPVSLSVRRIVHFTEEPPVALAFAADSVWTASASGRLARRMKDARMTAVQSYAPALHTTCVVFDGLYLWTCDAKAGKLVKRLTDADLTIVTSYRYPGKSPAGLIFDGKTLWSLDSVNHELIRHNIERPDEAIEKVGLPEYGDGDYRPSGLAFDGEHFWTVGEALPKDSRPARIFRHAVGGAR